MYRQEVEERRRQREAAHQRAIEAERRRRQEELRIQELEQLAAAWAKANQIRQFIAAVRQELARHGPVPDSAEYWVRWATDQVDRIDPLKGDPVFQGVGHSL